ncbi:ElaA protein [Amycolatopsis arida]|uniref:ElaA protein n=1 Tax=Amycolatopsis arida TaxID=587909 RepID=A0A1I5KLU9_9PSEU|nr:GNAT family N-acetyltransferase [Amycolatopsis arida]TDX97093.1 ElaA protein [Amycolatopsis arida]SFO85531.1 ElaA protein [Amycolatopsis arida]
MSEVVEDAPTVEVVAAAGPELSAAQLYRVLQLRVDVFVVEQECPYPELDGRDLAPGTTHFWVAEGDEVLACLRVLAEPDGTRRIGRVCTAAAARGRGLAARLMTAALETAGAAVCVLDAQTYAAGFYGRFGFVAEGEEFLEDGIPHVRMRRVPRTP